MQKYAQLLTQQVETMKNHVFFIKKYFYKHTLIEKPQKDKEYTIVAMGKHFITVTNDAIIIKREFGN